MVERFFVLLICYLFAEIQRKTQRFSAILLPRGEKLLLLLITDTLFLAIQYLLHLMAFDSLLILTTPDKALLLDPAITGSAVVACIFQQPLVIPNNSFGAR